MSPKHAYYRKRIERAKARRVELIRKLGAKCEGCGGTEIKVLEIDHIDGRTWSARGLCLESRIARYWREFREGVRLRVLCRRRNAIDGANRGNAHVPDPPDYTPARPAPTEEAPF
jgi:hypothetical protein